MANFDAQTKTTEDSYSAALLNTYGTGFATSAGYAQRMVDLEHSLAQQRLAIQAQYAQQAEEQQASAEQAASGVVSGLASYAQNLALGSSSPLNAQAQYALAGGTFRADIAKAQGGDATAIGRVQDDSSAFLSASQNLNGSGVGYAADFSAVVAALGTLANTSQTALTQSFMKAELETQTQVLSGNLQSLLAAVKSLQLEMQQANARPG